MKEFLGGGESGEFTARFITRCDSLRHGKALGPKMPGELEDFLSLGLDVSRSLWDSESLLVHLDIEYVNFDFPAEPYLDPDRSFHLQRPSENATEKFLLPYGISPLHLLSGRGHHFAWRIERGSAAYRQLCEIGHLPLHLEKRYQALSEDPLLGGIDSELGGAYCGLGLVMEYIACGISDRANPQTSIPVELTAVEVPPQQRGREVVSIDISEYGDQLNTRAVRMPFSLYLKPWCRQGIMSDEIRGRIPLMVSVPLVGMSCTEGIWVMRDLEKASELACEVSMYIPDFSDHMLKLIGDYISSETAQFHSWYYSQEQIESDRWNSTYDTLPFDILPPCAAHILQYPNDLLLRPSGIQLVVRVLLSLGWHPRQIAGLIRSKYERNYGWGNEWYYYDAATRADFYTRLFSGQVVSRRDNLKLFTCKSVKDCRYCFSQNSNCDLCDYRKSLLERVKHERLASRPVNRLFLPNEHF
ncbi:hypothetical protein CHISP_0258 [Chitinispirillum alkaliphilum]|nr:hypothetical protein CHISP_0258 [Chitinispirillum alkaliphilum]